jgi:16S rRNA (cytidine1402-2'-O)-methyltransferase
MVAILPPDRQIVIARELTKLHETIVKTTLANALELVMQDDNMRKGEFVVIVEGAAKVSKEDNALGSEQLKILAILMRECSTITGARKKLLYQAALGFEKAGKT